MKGDSRGITTYFILNFTPKLSNLLFDLYKNGERNYITYNISLLFIILYYICIDYNCINSLNLKTQEIKII